MSHAAPRRVFTRPFLGAAFRFCVPADDPAEGETGVIALWCTRPAQCHLVFVYTI